MRLDAYLARAGAGSRRDAQRWIRAGRVRVDGDVWRDPSRHVGEQAVHLDGAPLEDPRAALHLVLHKPPGVACSHDPREAPIVDDLLPETWRARELRMVGRLDRATSGLLVLTTEGALVQRMTHPRRKLPKRYRIGYSGRLVDDAVSRCRQGLLLDPDRAPTLPAELTLDRPARATLVLCEGRTHQVRRMIRALGGEVTELHRDRVGCYDLPRDLAPGELRRLATADLRALLNESSL